MDRIENVKSIQIDVELNGDVKLEIANKDKTIQVDMFKLSDSEKRKALNEFLTFHKLHKITTVTFNGVKL